MKYTNYLINGNIVDIDSIQTNNRILKYPIRFVSIPVVIVAIITIGGAIPIAVMADGYRNAKCRVIHYKRNHKNIPQFVTFSDILRIIDKPIQTVKVYGNSISKRR
jgi:hypothetical protein